MEAHQIPRKVLVA